MKDASMAAAEQQAPGTQSLNGVSVRRPLRCRRWLLARRVPDGRASRH
jgi:hypothetical protein